MVSIIDAVNISKGGDYPTVSCTCLPKVASKAALTLERALADLCRLTAQRYVGLTGAWPLALYLGTSVVV